MNSVVGFRVDDFGPIAFKVDSPWQNPSSTRGSYFLNHPCGVGSVVLQEPLVFKIVL